MRFLLSSFFVLLFSFNYAQIKTVQSFQEADLDRLTQDSLIIFDVDEVLITPADALLRCKNCKKFQRKYIKELGLTDEQYNELLSVMVGGTQYDLIDSTAPHLVHRLGKKGLTAMALTSCYTGRMGVIESVEDWRVKQLYDVNIDFSPFFTQADECVFEKLVAPGEHPPLFKNGILMCGDFYSREYSTKGPLLGVFLDWIQWKPDAVVFFDDLMENLLSVQTELEKRGIPFTGYLFSPEIIDPELDEKVADFQIRTAVKEKKWLSDHEARKALTN